MTIQKTLTALLLGTLLTPFLAFAQPAPQAPVRAELRDNARNQIMRSSTTKELAREPRTATSTKQSFCSQIDKVLITLDNRGSSTTEKRTEILKKQADNRNEHRGQVDARREENEAKRKSQIAELTKRATTNEQKLAITKFSTALEEALTIRNKAVDALLVKHRAEIDNVVASRKAEIDKAHATLTASLEEAKTQAGTECANSVEGSTVRNNLKMSIQKAQETFRATVSSVEKVKDVGETRKAEKKEELKKIEGTFKKSIETARDELKMALKASRPTESSTTTLQ